MTDVVRLAHLTTTDMSLDWLLRPQLEAFARAGFEVVGISAPGPHVDALVAAGIRHVPLRHATRAFSLGADVRAMRELVSVLRSLRPTILHTHNPKPGVYGRLAGRLARVPIVVNTQHGMYATEQDALKRRVAVYGVERVAAACSDAELVQNPEDLALLRRMRVPAQRLTLLGNGIDLTRFDPSTVSQAQREQLRSEWKVPDGHVVCGAVGRLVAEKGYRELFAAAAQLRERGVPVTFVVVGPSDLAKGDSLDADLLREAEREGIVLLGERSDVVALYGAFDLYVLASHREGFPRSAMEATAMGLPVVATDVRGCRQVVAQDETGLLVPPRSPAHLASAIAALALDPDRRRMMGRAGRLRARDHFDQAAVIDRTLKTYERLLDSKK